MVKEIFIKTTAVALVVFIAGILLGLWLGQAKVSALEETTTNLRDSIENAELQFALIDILNPEIACNYLIATANDLGKKSDELASEVERYESTQKITESDFIKLKTEYTSTLIRDWVTVEKIKTTCASNYTTILYFYSNINCDTCKNQGIVLTYMKDRLKENVMIFPLDVDLGLATVNALKDSFGIDKYPSLIIENKLQSGYTSLDDIKGIMCSNNSDVSIC